MKLDGSENTLLVAESVHGINIINGTILYFHEDTGTDARSYCKILEPGETEPQVLYSIEYDYDDQDDYNTDRFMCIGEDVYMSMLAASGRDGYGWAGYSLYRNNWDNSDGIDLINWDNYNGSNPDAPMNLRCYAEDFTIDAEHSMIYYSTVNAEDDDIYYLCAMGTDGSNPRILSTDVDSPERLQVYDGYLYFRDTSSNPKKGGSGVIKRLALDGGYTIEELPLKRGPDAFIGGSNEVLTFHAAHGSIYYCNSSDELRKYNLTTKEDTFIDDTNYYFGVLEDCLIYYDGSGFQIREP